MSTIKLCRKCNKPQQTCRCESKVFIECFPVTPEQAFASSEEGFTRTDIERLALPEQTTVLDLIADIATLVETTPNDMELGAEVRKLFT